MCGIAGILYRGSRGAGPVGQTVLTLLDVLGSRGVDGTGVALYGPGELGALVLTVRLEGADVAARVDRLAADLAGVAAVRSVETRGDYARLVVSGGEGELAALADRVEQADAGARVFSGGRALEIIKAVGRAEALRDYGLQGFRGSHGIGHTRLATESRVDVAHCHPFWARPVPDMAVVHNGQITNYHTLRRRMEARGVAFQTDNDSEIIGLYLGGLLAQGATLEEAMLRSMDDLDGTFTYLVSTAEGIGMARDPFGTKPLVVAETADWVAIASEEVALCTAFGRTLVTTQPGGGQVRVWRRATEDAGAAPLELAREAAAV